MERSIIIEKFTCGHVFNDSVVVSSPSRTLWSRVRRMITASNIPESRTIQRNVPCPRCPEQPKILLAPEALGRHEALAAIMMNQAPEAIRNIRQAADSATSRTDFQTIAFYGDSELQRQQQAYTADLRDLSRAENFWKEIHEEHEAHKGWKYPAATCELCEKERLLLTDGAGSYVSCPPKWMASPNPARQVGTPRVSKSTLSTKSSSLDSEEFSAEMPSEFDNFEFGFNDVDAEDPEMAPGLPVVQSQEEEQNLARPVHHTGLWQPAKHSIQLLIANQGLWSGLIRPTPHYTEYLFKSGPAAQPGASSQHNAEDQYTPKPAPKPKPTPQFSEFLFKSKPAMTVPTATTSGTISAWSFGHTVGLKLIVTPPSIGGVDDEEMDFSLKANSNFLQVLGQSYSSPLFPAFVEVPQRIVDPGTSEGTAELENLQWIQEESSSWSESDSDVTSTLSEEEGIDWSEARAPTPEELNPMRRFLDQEIGEVGYIYEEEQVPSCPLVSNSTLHGPPTREGTDNLETSDLDGIYSLYSSPQESSSPPPLTPAQTIILENQARLAEEFLERQRAEVEGSGPKLVKRKTTSKPSPLRQVVNAYPAPRKWNFHENLVTEERVEGRRQGILELQNPGPVGVYCIADSCLESRA